MILPHSSDSPLMISSIVSAFDALTLDGANINEKSFVQITRYSSSPVCSTMMF